jgi:hypothetical protein
VKLNGAPFGFTHNIHLTMDTLQAKQYATYSVTTPFSGLNVGRLGTARKLIRRLAILITELRD